MIRQSDTLIYFQPESPNLQQLYLKHTILVLNNHPVHSYEVDEVIYFFIIYLVVFPNAFQFQFLDYLYYYFFFFQTFFFLSVVKLLILTKLTYRHM